MTDPRALPGLRLLGADAHWIVERGDGVVVVRFFGDFTDADSDAWKRVAKESFDREGYPRFGYVDPTGGVAVTTLSSRMKTTAFLKETAQHMERVVMVTDTRSSFVVRTVFRAAGMPNVSLVDRSGADEALATLRRG